MRTGIALLALAAVLPGAVPARAMQPVPAGPALVVSHRGYNYDYPNDGYVIDARVATAADGGFVVVWTREVDDVAIENTLFSAAYGIFGRRYDATGTARGDEF